MTRKSDYPASFRALLYRTDGTFQTITLPNGLFYDEARKHLDYSSIQPLTLNFAGRTFDVLCDQEALLFSDYKVTIGIIDDTVSSIAGNVIVMTPCYIDEEGNEFHEDLSDDDIEYIKRFEKEFTVYDLADLPYTKEGLASALRPFNKNIILSIPSEVTKGLLGVSFHFD